MPIELFDSVEASSKILTCFILAQAINRVLRQGVRPEGSKSQSSIKLRLPCMSVHGICECGVAFRERLQRGVCSGNHAPES